MHMMILSTTDRFSGFKYHMGDTDISIDWALKLSHMQKWLWAEAVDRRIASIESY